MCVEAFACALFRKIFPSVELLGAEPQCPLEISHCLCAPDLVSVSPQQGQSLHVHFEIIFGSQKWNQSGFVGDSREGEKLRRAALSSREAVFMSDL